MERKQCACCGGKTLNIAIRFYGICPACGWEDDPIQNDDPDYTGGANHLSLNTAKHAIAEGKSLESFKIEAIQRFKERLKVEMEEETVTETVQTAAVM